NAPLKIFEISVDGDFIQANDCINPGAIAVGASCIVQVSFIPTAIGNRTGNLNITSSFTITPIMASLSGTGVDKTPPITAAIFSPFPNANGWNNSNITINLRAVDNHGGSGVQQISFSSAGAQFIPITDIVGNSASATISAEGITSFNFFATDLAGNIEPPHT